MREYLPTSPTARYHFSYSSGDGKSTELSCSVDEDSDWITAVESFLSFMEIIYGYPIKDQVLYDPVYAGTNVTSGRLVTTNWKPKKKSHEE